MNSGNGMTYGEKLATPNNVKTILRRNCNKGNPLGLGQLSDRTLGLDIPHPCFPHFLDPIVFPLETTTWHE